MANKDYGGPAFPGEPEGYDVTGRVRFYGGMTLRDYFAAKAMQAYVVRDFGPENSLAKYAYQQADEMIKARES